nr:dihydropyrimidinase [Quercus suber]
MFQFCNSGIKYGESSYGVSSLSSKILIKGGTIVNAHREEVDDVYVKDGIVVAVKPNIKQPPSTPKPKPNIPKTTDSNADSDHDGFISLSEFATIYHSSSEDGRASELLNVFKLYD